MGRMLGAFDPDNEIDRPDLNKCPDCSCFFAQDKCPLCGKICPEEMRAGNRKAVKPPKRKKGSGSGRVTFVEWYHSWWFIILMMFLFPIAGIVLLITSPHKKSLKIAFAVVAVIYGIISTIGIGNIIYMVTDLFDRPVNTSLDKAEYIELCGETDIEEFYRAPDSYKGEYLTMKLRVVEKITDWNEYYYGGEEIVYYVCESAEIDGLTVLIRDCFIEGTQNYIKGDMITVFGEGAGSVSVYDMEYDLHSAPCINVAYVSRDK